MENNYPYSIYPLGETALTIDWGNRIDEHVNEKVLQVFHRLRAKPLPAMIEALPAYSSLTVYYDAVRILKETQGLLTAFEQISKQLMEFLDEQSESSPLPGRKMRIPVCYDGPDLSFISETAGISSAELIEMHLSKAYRVYMIGFLPGFPYMGMVDEKISMPRKPAPVKVKAGSVGIAGRQTGIYPFDSPGGWQIIGRTPLKLFDDQKEDPALLKPGDSIQFYSISKDEFEDHQSRFT